MDVKSVLESGGYVHENPEYNPKTKTGKYQPKYIVNADPNGAINQGSALADVLGQPNRQMYNLDYLGDPEKYGRYGVTINPVSPNLDDELADAQSNWSKSFNALSQALISEGVLGTIKAFSDVIDAPLSAIFESDNNYTNPVSAKLEEWQEAFRNEITPIYTRKGVDIGNGGLSDFGWWASNAPSIMSSLTLLLPGMAGTKLLTATAKGLKLGKASRNIIRSMSRAEKATNPEQLNRLQKFLNSNKTITTINAGLESFTNAAIMRTVENYQEARGVYTDMYTKASKTLKDMSDSSYAAYIQRHPEFEKDGVNVSDKDAVAKHIASKAADKTFKEDYANMLFDVIQLYSLKNIGRTLGFAKKVESGAARRAQRESIAGLAKTAEEATATATKSKNSAYWDWIKDNYKGIARDAAAESTEGIEEAVNYIAQEEGLTYGRILLENEKPSNFDTRFQDYIRNPKLYDAAFWGFLGGIVFEGGGNVLQKAKVVYNAKKKAKDRAKNDKTQEGRDVSGSWIELLETAESTAAVNAIKSRNIKFNQLKTDIEQIKSGVNIFGKTDETTNLKPNFTGTEEDINLQKELAIAKAIQNYRTSIALDAASSGTYDMLKEYVQDKNFKQAMIDAGFTTAETADSFIQETLSDMDKAVSIYDGQVTHVKHQADFLNTRKGARPIPDDYIQIIAAENTGHRLNIEELNRRISILENKANAEGMNIPSDFDYEEAKQLIQYGRYAQLYGMLEANKKSIIADTSRSPMQKQIEIKEIETRQKAIIDELRGKQDNINTSNMLWALRYADRTILDNGQHKYSDSFASRTDKELIEEFEKTSKTNPFSGTKKTVDALVQETDDLVKKYNNLTSSETGLVNTSRRLYDLFFDMGDLQTEIASERAKIVSTSDEIAERVDFYHNQNNEARLKAVTAASDVIDKLYAKYTSSFNRIEDIITLAYNGRHEDAEKLANKILTDQEAAELIKAIDIFNFTQEANDYIYKYIAALVEGHRKQDEMAIVNSSTSEDSISEEQNGQSISSSESSPVEEIEAGSTEIEQQNVFEVEQENELPSRFNIEINDDGSINLVATNDEKGLTGEQNPLISDDYEIDFATRDKNDIAQYLNSPLFADTDFDITNEDISWHILDNPILRKVGDKYIIEQPGTIVRDDDQSEPASNSSTGEVTTQKLTPDEDIAPEPPVQLEATIQEILNNESNKTIINWIYAKVGQAIEGENFDATSTKESILSEVPTNNDKILVGKIIDYVLEDAAEVAEELKNNTLEGATNATILSSKFIDISGGVIDYSGIFEKSFDKLVEKYVATLMTPEINGKKVIKVGDLMDFCSQAASPLFNTDETSVFNVIQGYLLANPDKYIVLDKKDVANGTYQKSKEDAEKEITVYDGSFRIDINGVLDATSNQETIAAIKSLRADRKGNGTPVTIIPSSSQRAGLAISTMYNGHPVVIGRMAIPVRVGNTNTIQFYNGFRQDLTPNGNHVDSKLKDFLIDVFTSNNKDYKDVRDILIQEASGIINRDDAIKLLSNTNLFKQLVAQAISDKAVAEQNKKLYTHFLYLNKTNNPDYYKLFDYMSNLLKYTSNVNATTYNERRDNIVNSLTEWFDKLYDNYMAALTVYENQQQVSTNVTYATEGDVDFVTDNSMQDYDKLSYIQDGIGNECPAYIGMVSSNTPGEVVLAGSESVTLNNMIPNSTVVILKTPNANIPVKAVSMHMDDPSMNDKHPLWKLRNGIGLSLHRALMDYALGRTQGVENLTNWFGEVFGEPNGNRDRVGILQGKHGIIRYSLVIDKAGYENIHLSYRDANNEQRYLTIKTRGSRGIRLGYKLSDGNGRTISASKVQVDGRVIEGGAKARMVTNGDPLVNFTKEELQDLTKILDNIIVKDSAFKISRNGITYDNTKPTNWEDNSFMRYENGKFVVEIKDDFATYFKETYDSYQDFLFKNNVIKVNAKATDRGDGKTSSLTFKGKTQLGNKVVHIKIPNVTQIRTTTNTKPEIHILPGSSITEYNELKTILDGTDDIGFKLLSRLVNKDLLKDNNFVTLAKTLLPSDIKYDADMNDIELDDDGKVKLGPNNKPIVHGDVAQVAVGPNARYNRTRRLIRGRKYSTARLAQGRVVIGDLLLSYLSGTQFQKKEAVTHLIHEQLHNIIHTNTEFTPDQIYAAIEDIYNEFITAFQKELAANPNKPEYKYIANWVAKYNQAAYDVNPSNKRIKLEEFIVESVTNQRFMDFLNSVDTTDVGETKKSLFDKIIEFIMKYIWGKDFEIKDGKLLRKELNLLAGAINPREDTSSPVEENGGNTSLPEDVGKSTEVPVRKRERRHSNINTDIRLSTVIDDVQVLGTYNTINIDEHEVNDSQSHFITSTQTFKKKLSFDEQEKFDAMIDNGVLNYHCK